MQPIANASAPPGLNDYLPPAERLRIFRELDARAQELISRLIPDPRPDDWSERDKAQEKLEIWYRHSILYVPGTYPGMPLNQRGQYRRHQSYLDWRERKQVKRRISSRFRRIAIRRAKGRCAYCNGEVPARRWVIDHIFPVRWGGRSRLSNLIAACWDCNAEKRDDIWQPLYYPPGFRWPRFLTTQKAEDQAESA